MSKRFLLVLSVYCIVLTLTAFAQENMGARPVAMGGAFTGLADDANAIFVNPAGIGYLSGEHSTISTKILEGKEYVIMGGVEKTPFGSFGIGYMGASYPLETLSENNKDANTLLRAQNQTLILSFARELNDFMVVPKNMGQLSIGTSLKLSSSKASNGLGLSVDQGSGINADFAAVFKPNEDLSYGLNLKDFFSSSSQTESSPNLAMGISGKLLNKSITWSLEGQSLGCEWKPVSGLALRAGRDGDYNTAGFGINVNGFGIDYAYMEKEVPIHYIGFSIAVEKVRGAEQMARPSLESRASFL